ncbi:MAG: hypothetical protein ACRDP8_09780 [Actinopolymorphaceae bacterium]
MRWESLFADLDAQMAELEAAELTSELADRTRREVARFRLVDRLRPTFGHPVTVHTLGGGKIAGTVAGVGSDWLLVAEEHRLEALVPLDAITGITGLGGLTAAPGSEGKVAARLTLGFALRGIARDRAAVLVALRDATAVTGTIDRVGADFFEMAEHGQAEIRRTRDIRGVRTVPFAGVSFVRRS